jgi:hypothetical protein
MAGPTGGSEGGVRCSSRPPTRACRRAVLVEERRPVLEAVLGDRVDLDGAEDVDALGSAGEAEQRLAVVADGDVRKAPIGVLGADVGQKDIGELGLVVGLERGAALAGLGDRRHLQIVPPLSMP